jgi:hypothetical protein
MTFDVVNRVYRGWRKAPPTRRLAAWFMGFKADKNAPSGRVSTKAEIDALIAETRR